MPGKTVQYRLPARTLEIGIVLTLRVEGFPDVHAAVRLVPEFPRLKAWAYAGFLFAVPDAAISHAAVGDPMSEILPSLLLLTLTVVSWYLRPAKRKFA